MLGQNLSVGRNFCSQIKRNKYEHKLAHLSLWIRDGSTVLCMGPADKPDVACCGIININKRDE